MTARRETCSENPKNKRSTFSNFIYQTNHRFRGRIDSDTTQKPPYARLEPVQEPGETPENLSVQDICTQTNFRSKTSVNLKRSPRKVDIFKERCTQTSKTVITLEEVETVRLSPDSLSPHPDNNKRPAAATSIHEADESGLSVNELDCIPFQRKESIYKYIDRLSSKDSVLSAGNALTKAYLEKNKNKIRHTVPEVGKINYQTHLFSPKKRKDLFKSQSFVESISNKRDINKEGRINFTRLRKTTDFRINPDQYMCPPCVEASLTSSAEYKTPTPVRTKRSFSFMSPTIASEKKDQSIEIKNIEQLISPTRRGRSASPKNPKHKNNSPSPKIVPYIDKSQLTIKPDDTTSVPNENDLRLQLNTSCEAITCASVLDTSISNTSTECALFQAIAKLRDPDWNKALRGLAEVVEICRLLDPIVVHPHMTAVNQRLVELIKSPRSHVCRTSCQAVGHLFEYVKDTRRPEFDELVDTLLMKTADSNKFIRHDANLALDCMVTHIPTFHAVRSLCSKGPDHKNPLVRIAAARLLVCAVVIAGPQTILHPHNNEYTRRRIILNMVKFLDDRSREIRKFGERLYKLFYKERIFDLYLKRYLEKDVIQKIKKCLTFSNGQKL